MAAVFVALPNSHETSFQKALVSLDLTPWQKLCGTDMIIFRRPKEELFFKPPTWRQQGESVNMAVDLCLNFDWHRRLRPNLLPFLLLSVCSYFSFLSQDSKCVYPKAICPHDTSMILSLLPECRHNVTNQFRLLLPHHAYPAGMSWIPQTEKPRCPLSLELPAR